MPSPAAWPDRRILDLFGIDLPIVQAPMANSSTPEMALAVRQAGGLGSIPCAALTPDPCTPTSSGTTWRPGIRAAAACSTCARAGARP